jgi:hypothetical protein
VPVATYPVPFGASSAGGGVVIDFSQPAVFVNGLAFCITGALADNDSTNAATGVVVNLLYR